MVPSELTSGFQCTRGVREMIEIVRLPDRCIQLPFADAGYRISIKFYLRKSSVNVVSR